MVIDHHDDVHDQEDEIHRKFISIFISIWVFVPIQKGESYPKIHL